MQLLERARSDPSREFMIWRGVAYTYEFLLREARPLEAIPNGAVVALEADFSPRAVALLLALIQRNAIVVPLSSGPAAQRDEFREVAEVEWIVNANGAVTQTGARASHELTQRLRDLEHPGLILFSSGSTGKAKAALHDFVPLLEKFNVPRASRRMITFLLFDHIGGINTLFYALSNAGCLITVESRDPDTVCAAIERHKADVLPATPTFLQLLMFSEAYKRFDLSSLKLVTYGTEPMSETTLRRFHELFPHVELQQTYGLSELGILRSKSKAADSLWVKLGGEGFETRVRDGLLEIRARSSMLGYLNAPSPFTDDGWFQTGDAVEVDGDYYRILGRRSEMINVGGEKVHPAEVEGVLEQIPGVETVAVHGEKSAITGQIVVAHVKLATDETAADFRRRMRAHCRERLAPYKVPQKVIVSEVPLYGERFKKKRP